MVQRDGGRRHAATEDGGREVTSHGWSRGFKKKRLFIFYKHFESADNFGAFAPLRETQKSGPKTRESGRNQTVTNRIF